MSQDRIPLTKELENFGQIAWTAGGILFDFINATRKKHMMVVAFHK